MSCRIRRHAPCCVLLPGLAVAALSCAIPAAVSARQAGGAGTTSGLPTTSSPSATGAIQQAREAPVRVEVRGVRGELRDNVLATVTLARTPSRTALSLERVRSLLQRAPREVSAALEPYGFYDAAVRDSVSFDGRRWRVVLDVTPGAPVVLQSADVRVEGPGAADTAFARVLLSSSSLQTGAPVSHPAWEALKSSLAALAVDRGYLDAAFDSAVIRVDRSAREANAVLVMQTGPRFRLGEVTFVQEGLDIALLEDLVPWEPGDPYTGARLFQLQSALNDGPYFSSVEIVPRRDRATEDGQIPVVVNLTLTRPQLYSIGGGYGTDTGARVLFNAEFRRLNRKGHRAEIDAWLAQTETRATASYLIPLREHIGTLLSLNAGWLNENPETSQTQTWLIGSTIEGLRGGWRTQMGATLERATFEVGPQSGITTLFLLGTSVSRVRADDRIEPLRGSLLRVRLRGGRDGIVSEVDILDGGVEARLVRGLWGDRWRVLWRGEVAGLATSDFASLPGSIRYFAGGDRSIRGYGYQELGPRDPASGAVIGGTRLLVTSIEIDARVRSGWRVAAFADVGNALNSLSGPLEAGVGGGIRWRSPIGMVRLDGAFAATSRGWPFRVHFNLGPEL